MSINFVKFEADEQRQHARYKLPLKCVIEQHRYATIDWSVAGVGVATGPTVFPVGKIVPIQLQFPFEGFDFSLNMKAEVRYSESSIGRTGLKFVEISESNVRILRYVLDSYLAGEILTVNELLDFAGRPISIKPRAQAAPASEQSLAQRSTTLLRQSARIAAALLVTAGIVALLANSIYQKLWTFEATRAVVRIDSTPVFSPGNGRVTHLMTGPVKVGERILTVLTDSGQSMSVVASCDCIAEGVGVGAKLDMSVRTGDQMLSLRASDATPHVVAMIDEKYLVDLYKGTRVTIDLPRYGVIHNAQIVDLPRLSDQADDMNELVQIKIDLGNADIAAAIGTPAEVYFDKGPLAGIRSGLQSFADRLFGRASVVGNSSDPSTKTARS